MTHRQVVVHDLEYDFTPDGAPLVTRRHWAIGCAQLVDEITEEPIRVPLRLRTETPQVVARAGADGTFCLATQPGLRFPAAPGPRPQVRVHVTANGFLPLTIDFTVPFDARTVAAPALAAGGSVATLSSTAGLLSGQAVVIGTGSREEFAHIDVLGPGANQVTLAEPCKFAHAAGDAFIPATLPTIVVVMHRQPVTLRGRVVRPGVGGALPTPVANATIKLADYWRTQNDVRSRPFVGSVPVGPMTVPLPAPKVFMVALVQGVVTTRAIGAAAAGVVLVPAAGDEKHLVRAAAPEQTTIRVSDRRNLVPGSLVRIDAGDREISEIRTVNTVVGVGGADDPATVTLEQPLLRAHPPDARVDRIPPPMGPLPIALQVAAAVGDRSVFVDALPGLPAPALRVASVGIPDEHHDCSRYEATSDAQGYFRLPPIHRVAQVRLDVDDGVAPTPARFFVDPDYADSAQWLDLRLT